MQLVFWLYAGLMGLSLAMVFLVFTGASVARVFFITAGTFAAMSLYGYTTQRDLSQFGSFLFMGLIGIVIASLVNLFIGSTALQFAISVIGVLVFTGLTAYDTQQIKEMYYEGDGSEIASKKAIMGASAALPRLHQPVHDADAAARHPARLTPSRTTAMTLDLPGLAPGRFFSALRPSFAPSRSRRQAAPRARNGGRRSPPSPL